MADQHIAEPAQLDVSKYFWEPRHNIVAFLNTNAESSRPYRPMIAFLRRSRIYKAITADTRILTNHITEFWDNAAVNNDEEDTRIISRVCGREVILSEQLVRDFFEFGDHSDMITQFGAAAIAEGMRSIGYQDIPVDQYKKTYMTKVWRYLAHIVIVCLSSRRAGLEGMSYSTASAFLALIFNKPFNFSGYIFRGFVNNALGTTERWALYPRFTQLLLNHLHPDLPVIPSFTFKQTPMNTRIYITCASFAKQGQAPDREVALFGHIMDPAYVGPPGEAFVAPRPEQPIQQPPVQQPPAQPSQVQQPPVQPDLMDPELVDLDREIDSYQPPSPPPESSSRGKRARTSTTTSSELPRAEAPITPHPAVIQELLSRIDRMQHEMAAQSAIFEAQDARISRIEKENAELRSKVLLLEAQGVSSGEKSPPTLESTPRVSADENVNSDNVTDSTINETTFVLDYIIEQPGQPKPLAVDYTYCNLTYLQAVVNASGHAPEEHFDFESVNDDDDVNVEQEELEQDEMYTDSPTYPQEGNVVSDSSDDESGPAFRYVPESTSQAAPAHESSEHASSSHEKPVPVRESTNYSDIFPQDTSEYVPSDKEMSIRDNWFPKGKNPEPVPVTCKKYKVGGDYSGLIKS